MIKAGETLMKILFGLLTVLFLLGSFPARSYCGTMVSDIMRLMGGAFLLLFIVLRIRERRVGGIIY